MRVWISALSENLKTVSKAYGKKEMEILLIGYIAELYKKNLLDPLDKPPNLLKTCIRLYEILVSCLKVQK